MSSTCHAITPPKRPTLFTGRRLRKIQEAGLGYLFLLPAFGILAAFEFIPVFYGLGISLCTNYRIKFEEGTGCAWGFNYYIRAFNDPEMWHSLAVTVWYSLLSVPIQLGIALVLYGPVADSYAKMFDWAKYAMIESPVAGYDPVRALIDTDVMSKVLTDPKADVKALLDAAVKKSNDVLKENAPK